jgi:HlyD family secretion protein
MKLIEREAVQNGHVHLAGRPARARIGWVVAVVLLLMAGVAAAVLVRARLTTQATYITQPVVRKDLVQSVTATGTVNPRDLILVGTQVSGTVSELDVDYNSQVKAGQVLARIDPTSLQAAFDQARSAQSETRLQARAGTANAEAALHARTAAERTAAAARAALASAASQVDKATSALALADLTLQRDRNLLAAGYIAQSVVDTDTSNEVAAKAAVASATIAVTQARSALEAQTATAAASASSATGARQSAAATGAAIDVQAAVTVQAAYNLGHSVIVSPVDGTVIARNVSIGQTVAASFQTPTLFSIARDLTRMQVDIAVGEPDIGGVRAGAVADFTVLAYPNRTFHGAVWQVRQNPTTLNNVVTYDTVLLVDNRDGALRPGMTANASVHVGKAAHALVVPVQALQWAPSTAERRPAAETGSTPASPWGATEASVARTVVGGRPRPRVVKSRAGPAAIRVRIDLVAGTEAAVEPLAGTLAAGDAVIVSDTATAAVVASPPATRNALAPNRGGIR